MREEVENPMVLGNEESCEEVVMCQCLHCNEDLMLGDDVYEVTDGFLCKDTDCVLGYFEVMTTILEGN